MKSLLLVCGLMFFVMSVGPLVMKIYEGMPALNAALKVAP